MKKKIYLYGICLLGGVTLSTSCTDMLDKEPLDSFTNSSSFWDNSSSVEGYANSFYNLFTGYGNSGGTGKFYFKYLSDDQVGASYQTWKYTNVPASDTNWSDPYEEIRRANAMIESLNTMAPSMDEATKNHWIGIARLMRGWQHWDLVRKYGDCIWMDHVPDIDDPLLYAARDDRDEVMDNVLEDLKFACENIEEEGTSTKTTWSRNMARALTADICLWEGTFRKYRTLDENSKAPDGEGAQTFLNYCVEVCTPLIESYALGTTPESYRAIYNSTSLADNSEIIFCKAYTKDVFSHSLIAYTCSSTQMSSMSKDAFDSYLLLDGTLADDNDAAVIKVSENDKKEHLNISSLLEARDRRLAQTIDSVLCYNGNAAIREGSNAMTASTGYGICKYDNTSIEVSYRVNTSSNYTWAPICWLSVVYLNYAEAKAELGTITNNDLDMTVNKLKARAGLPSITTSVGSLGDNDMGVSDLIWEIRRERRCELMFDNDYRYWDLIRWHQLDKLDTEVNPDITLGANLKNDTGTYNGTLKDGYINGYVIDGTEYTRTYDKKHYLYPIPSGQITLNSNLGQNLGW